MKQRVISLFTQGHFLSLSQGFSNLGSIVMAGQGGLDLCSQLKGSFTLDTFLKHLLIFITYFSAHHTTSLFSFIMATGFTEESRMPGEG